MTSSTPTRPSTSLRLIALGVVATLVLFLTGAVFAANANAETSPRLVWVCKYAGPPSSPKLQNVISVSSSATVGWTDEFKDAHPSYVLREVAEGEGRGAAPAGLEAECPEAPPGDGDEPGDEPGDENGDDGKDDDAKDDADDNGAATDKPVAAPTDLRSTQMTGLASLFAIAAALLGAAAYALRGARN